MARVKCPECGNEFFEEMKHDDGTANFTVCTKCGTAYIIKELVKNWNRWNSMEHIRWIEKELR